MNIVKQNLEQMLNDRGYQVTERKKTHWVAAAAAPSGNPAPATATPATATTTYVNFLSPEDKDLKIGIETIRAIEKLLPMHETIIVVYAGSITSAAKTVASLYPKLQFFHVRELHHNITKHEFVPKHTLMSDSEAEEFLARHKFTRDQLPKLSVSDPLAKYFHFKPGSLIRIRRKFGVQIGEYDYVRVVVQHV